MAGRLDSTAEVAALDDALAALGVTDATLDASELEQLDRDGFLVLPGLIGSERLERLRERIGQLETADGHEFGRSRGAIWLYDLINKGEVFESCFTEPKVLAAARHVVGDIRVNSLHFRAALPGAGRQDLHSDWGKAIEHRDFHLCNSMWLLDDFTEDNGATRVVPGSHRWDLLPGEVLDDPSEPYPGERLLLGVAGTVIVFNAHLWHGGTTNRTGAPRRGMTLSYCRRDEPQQDDQHANIRKAVYERPLPRGTFSTSEMSFRGFRVHS